jgi:ATP-dependent HslUV protease ATP-binding subunit HslU
MKEPNKVTKLNLVKENRKKENSKVSALSPREIVSELDRYVVGQTNAKKAVAIALRNRWRRHALDDQMREEVLPKNILMIGPTGVGKTEISRRLSKLAQAPFIKVEATRFTEVGYVGRDVEQIIRDLIEIAIALEKVRKRKEVYVKAQLSAEEIVLNSLVGNKASVATKESFRKRLRDGDLDNNEIEIEVSESPSNMPSFEIPGIPGGNIGMINVSEILGKSIGQKPKKKKMTVKESHDILITQESDKMIEQDKIISEAIKSTEDNGIVFLDEIDKISARGDRTGGDISREGVQRDLLPLIEGTVVNTKHGPIKTDHILFIASGAFQLAKPSDLLPELQGRLPIRVELNALTEEDYKRILIEPDNSLIKQYVALLKTENVELEFTNDGIDLLAKVSAEVNASVENIGARRLHTLLEKVLEDISFTATDRTGEKVIIDNKYIEKNLGDLTKDMDLSKFIL